MRSAFLQLAPDRRRAVAFLIVVAVHALLALLLLTLTPQREVSPDGAIAPTVVRLLPVPRPKAVRPPGKRVAGARARPKGTTPKPATPVAKPAKTPADKPFTTELFEAIDITKLPNRRAEMAAAAGAGQANDGAGRDSETVAGPGDGPDGQPLYQAEWYSEPTHAELATYLTRGAPQNSWGIIACKTIDKYRVDDCRELAESPLGSGLARSLRQAAWQFRVRPPRIGGKPLIGAWVRIRIDFSERGPD